jgi:hypothetical protein
MRRALCTISVAVVLATRLLAQTPVTAAEEAPSIPKPQPRGARRRSTPLSGANKWKTPRCRTTAQSITGRSSTAKRESDSNP